MIESFIAIFLTVAAPQAQGTTPPPSPRPPSSSIVERSSGAGAGTPSRLLQTRTEVNGREVVTETTEAPDMNGRMKMLQETTTETVKTGPGATESKREVFRVDAQGRRQLVESTQAETQTQSDGSSVRIANTLSPDANGRLGLSIREVQEIKTVAPNVKQTDTTIYHPGVNGPLRESERVRQTEQKISAELTQSESARFRPDANGKWQVTEARNQEVRTAGSERVEEETVRRVNDSGTLELSERKVTRQSKSNSEEQTVTEIYSQNVGGLFRRADNRLELDRRERITTTAGGETIRELEARNPLAPNEPLRVIERTVETVRQVAPGQWETQRQVFALDGNGRLVPVFSEKGASAK